MESPIDIGEEALQNPRSEMGSLFIRNLFGIVILGVVVTAWVIAYTDWFPEFAGLLALGGLFSWLAVVGKILPEDRVKYLQNWVDTSILNGRWTSSILAGLFAIGLLTSVFLGTVEVESIDTTDRGVAIARADGGQKDPVAPAEEERDAERLPPGGRVRSVFWTFPFWPTTARVQVTAYPYQFTAIHSLRISKLYVPESFLRPALLVKPGSKLMSLPPGYSIRIYVSTGGPEVVWDNVAFDGHAFWIGCGKEVEIPKHTVETLREDLKAPKVTDKSQALRLWFNVHSGSIKSLPAGANVRLKIVINGAELPGEAADTVRRPESYLDFPQVLEIEAP